MEDKVRKFIEECRDVHSQYARWMREFPDEAHKPLSWIEYVGGASFHEYCVRMYNKVLERLGEIPAK